MKIIIGLIAALLSLNLHARSAQDYLPANADLDPAIPSPESILGWEVGDWHVSHDKLVRYMFALAEASPRVSLKVIGHTYEQRPLLQLAITSSGNQQNLEALRQSHLQGDGPLVVWLGYSVHGNEPSGSNASMLVAYYLAASRSDAVRELLEGSVILVDPSFNPDGLNRFATWANSNAGKHPVADPLTRQHMENWPGGRTNHYWFDLNRDWLPLVHPESRARIEQYHRWLPHVLTDHHEQGGRPGFFFQPGVPSRQNPLTPMENLEITRALAAYHSRAMDAVGQPYFSEDVYDDFYFGKGSTYPDINGGVGILFEQRAIRGQELATGNGTETFRMAIANHLRASLSSLEGAWALREKLAHYQSGFSAAMLERAEKTNFSAWIVGDDGDPARARAFLDVLERHRIQFQPLAETVRSNGLEFAPGHAWVIPVRQKQFGLLEAMMEQRTRFEDATFYDVSAWTQPLAYNLPYTTAARLPASGTPVEASNGVVPDQDVPAWAIAWSQLNAPALLQNLLTADIKVRTALKPFSAQTINGLQAFAAGTLVVQAGIQTEEALRDARSMLVEAALSGLQVHGLTSTMTAVGPDLGSPHFPLLRPISPLIIGGQGISSYDAGETWFLLDQRLGMATPLVEASRLNGTDLSQFTHLLLPNGEYKAFGDERKADIVQWVKRGGILVTSADASAWAESLCFKEDIAICSEGEVLGQSMVQDETPIQTETSVTPRAYGDFPDDLAQGVIGGAITASRLDLSHPLAFGFQRADLPLFRRGTMLLEPSPNPYSAPVRYTDSPLMAGFIGERRLVEISGQPAVIAEKTGKGLVIRFANNPLFRGFWRGTEKLFINALYFGQIIQATEIPDYQPPSKPETLPK